MNLTSRKKIRFGVVGLGQISQGAVLPAFENAVVNTELTALISGDQEKLRRLGEKYNVKNLYLYSQFEDCLRNNIVDAVYIATPNFYHRELMETAAKYGIHVLCEKPMALTSEDCQSMIQTAKANHVHLMIAYRLHLEEGNLQAIKLAHESALGELKIFNSTFCFEIKDKNNIRLDSTHKGGGPLYDIGIYCINAARNLFNSEPVEVMAMSLSSDDPRFEKTDETISAIMKFPDCRVASFTIGFSGYHFAEFDLIGDKGRLKLENAYEYDASINLKLYKEDEIVTRNYPRHDQFSPELIYFSDCILNNIPPSSLSGEEGLADLKVIEAMLLSLERNSPVRLDEFKYEFSETRLNISDAGGSPH